MTQTQSAACAPTLSAKAQKLIGTLTRCASMVHIVPADSEAIKTALHEWAIAKSELATYVAELESGAALVRAEARADALAATLREIVDIFGYNPLSACGCDGCKVLRAARAALQEG